MKSTNKFVALAVLGGALVSLLSFGGRTANRCAEPFDSSLLSHISQAASRKATSEIPFLVQNRSCPNPSAVLASSAQPQDVDDFSWQTFIALNWPAKVDSQTGLPLRGVADDTKQIGDPGVRVWQTWKADYELFQEKAAAPSEWDSYEIAKPLCEMYRTPGSPTLAPFAARGLSIIARGVNQAIAGPLIAQQAIDGRPNFVRYEVRINKTQYEQTRSFQWYDKSKLPRYPNPQISFPSSECTPQPHYGAIAIKAAWREMTPSEMANPAIRGRYFITEAILTDPATGKCRCEPAHVGLVGFHIAHKTAPFKAWVWSSFEQVDNVPCVKNEVDRGDPDCVSARPGGYSLNNGTNTPNAIANGYAIDPGQPDTSRPYNPKKPPTRPVQVIRASHPNNVRTDIVDANNMYRTISQIRGTVWQYYKLVANQWPDTEVPAIKVDDPEKLGSDPYPKAAGGPLPEDKVANVTMETYFQSTTAYPLFGTSCIHCHYRAAQTDFSWITAEGAFRRRPAKNRIAVVNGLPNLPKLAP